MAGPSGVGSYSTTAATNATFDGGAGNWAENQLPSTVNNTARLQAADLRNFANDLIWFPYGSGDQAAGSTYLGVPYVYASSTSVTIAGVNVTTAHHAGRRMKFVGTSTGTIYGTISSSTFSTNTTINLTWDSGSLSNETLTGYLSQVPVTGTPVPITAFSGVMPGANGGTGVANTGKTITLGGNLTTTGAFNTVFTQQASATFILPAAGDTLVGRTSIDTLTNKTLAAPVVTTSFDASGTDTVSTDPEGFARLTLTLNSVRTQNAYTSKNYLVLTGTTGDALGYGALVGYTSVQGNGANFSGIVRGVYGIVDNASSSTINLAISGYFPLVNRLGGTITNGQAVDIPISNLGVGTITDARAINIGTPVNSGGGTITSFTGVYIADPGVVAGTSFSIRADGGTAFFGGKVGIGPGTTSPSQQLEVTGGFRLSGNIIFGTAGSTIGLAAGGTPTITMNSTNVTVAGGHLLISTSTDNGALTVAGVIAPEANNTRDLGTSSFAFRNVYVAGSLTYGGVAIAASVTGTGSIALSASPTFTGTITASAITMTGAFDHSGASTFRAFSGTSIPAAGTSFTGYMFSSTNGFGMYFGSNVPTVSAAQGSIYLRSDGSSTSTRLYVATNNSGTWTNVVTAA